MKSGKALLVKSVKEISPIVIETLHFENPVGGLKSKYYLQISAATRLVGGWEEDVIFKMVIFVKSLKILPNQTARSDFHGEE